MLRKNVLRVHDLLTTAPEMVKRLTDFSATTYRGDDMGSVEDFRKSEPVGFLLARASQYMRLQLGRDFADAGLDISVEQWRLLLELWQQDGLNQRELGERCFKSKVSVTKMLAKLEDQGYVLRRRSTRDRRGNRVFLTAAGKRLRDVTLELAAKNNMRAVDGVDDDDLAAFKRVARTIFLNME